MGMSWVRDVCVSFPGATEQVQWGNDLVFKVGGKMFAVVPLEPVQVVLSFKCRDHDYPVLIERPGVIPAPYLARAQWAAMEREDAIPARELKELLRAAYETVLGRLPKKVRDGIGGNQ
jgi:predicted DNA-binding protein (MmcQ/YjbR family)